MPSFAQVAVASALVGLGAAAPVNTIDATNVNSVAQTVNPKHVANGPAAYAKALAKFGASATHVGTAMKAAGGSGTVVATPEAYDSEYLCPVTIGNQKFNLDFDTGSSDLWVFGKGSTTDSSHTVYAPGSTAKKSSGSTWEISYGDGSSASGSVYADTVTVGGTKVTKQAVEAATTASSQFASGAEDGLLGLAFSKINTVKPKPVTTFIDSAIAQGLPAVFAADLQAGKPGAYDFGALNSAYSASDITYTDVDDSQGFWSFTPDSVAVGTGKAMTGTAGIADTGTTLMLLDDDVVTAYYKQVAGAKNDATQGGYVFPCKSKLPDFTVTIGKHAAVVPGKYMSFQPLTSGSATCFGGIQSDADIGFAIYGDVFLKSQYVVFDQTTGTPRLGLADKAS